MSYRNGEALPVLEITGYIPDFPSGFASNFVTHNSIASTSNQLSFGKDDIKARALM